MLKIIDKIKSTTSQNCLICERQINAGNYRHLCVYCVAELPQARYFCRRCGLSLAPEQVSASCGNCLLNPPQWQYFGSAYFYEQSMQWLLAQFKFAGQKYLMTDFKTMFSSCLIENFKTGTDVGAAIDFAANPWDIDFIVPMPMHPWRWLSAGQNHAYQLATAILKLWSVPIDTSLVKRVKLTPRLAASANKKERLKIVENAFVATKKARGRACIIDDVLTTGASCEAVAKCLSKAGVEVVAVLVLARTDMKT